MQTSMSPKPKTPPAEKPQDIEFTSDGSLVIWREKFPQGRVGPWTQTAVETNERDAFLQLRRELFAERGLEVPGTTKA